jgi:hypothetical protein
MDLSCDFGPFFLSGRCGYSKALVVKTSAFVVKHKRMNGIDGFKTMKVHSDPALNVPLHSCYFTSMTSTC